MEHRLTELQATYLELAGKQRLGAAGIARALGATGDEVKSAAKRITLALSHICNNFAAADPVEAYNMAVAEGLITPSES